ncbi:F0F1 ATP synthase subunit B [Sphingomonas sp.]|uniref:F0F1 ATP synthase subunit B family protein n=1 Tax=Sphingomonas sp. TaxID=28214 RepID=UPI003B002192
MPDRTSSDPQTAAVIHNLTEADKLQGMPHTGGHATTEANGGADHHEEASLLGGYVTGGVVVSLAMIVFIAILLWKKVPGVIAGSLDKQIADIRRQLDEAKALRAEAEALRDGYAAKIAAAEGTAGEMLTHAQTEADALIAKANVDAAELVERRGRMAEDKIAAAERAALAEVRAHAADAASRAAASLIASKHGVDADRTLVDRTIAGLGRPN